MADQVFWNRDSEQDRTAFARALAPLVAASRTKTFTRAEATAYMLSLQDVPPTILDDAIAALIRRGVDWMPKPGDLKRECATVMAAKRKAAAAIHLEGCDHSSHYIDVNGMVERCPCWKRAMQAMSDVGQAISLPPSREDAAELAP